MCWSIRNVKFINESFYNMRCLVMFITAVCLLFLPFRILPQNKVTGDNVLIQKNIQATPTKQGLAPLRAFFFARLHGSEAA